MNKAVFQSEIKGFRIKIKTVQSGKYLITKDASSFTFDPEHKIYITFTKEEMLKLNIGQYYKIQVAYISEYLSTDGTMKDMVGYFSTVGIVKYTSEPKIEISGLEKGTVNTHNYQYMGVYNQYNQDTSEKAYSYCFNLYDNEYNLIQTSGEQIHDSSHDTEYYESVDFYNIQQDLDINKSYYLEYVVTTTNKLLCSSGRYRIMQKKSIDPEIKADLILTANQENGYVVINLKGHKNSEGLEYAATGSFKILRASDEDNYATWNEVLRFALYGQQPSRWIWKDLTVKQGLTYKYALQQYNDQNLTSNRLESNEIYVDFEHAFLFDGKRQLKIKYNPKVSTFKNDILESKTDTIGSQFPFIFRNGTVKYKEFPISGLISCQSDEEFLFINEEDLGKFDGSANLIGENIASEREFKLEVLEWLNNGKPKLFRSPTEGNYIVRLLNISLSPNDTVGRMLHTFSATAYEIAEYTYENLTKYGLISTGDPTVQQLRWETVDFNKTGFGNNDNLIKYKAVSLHFEGMVPGDKLWINDGIERDFKQVDENGNITSYLRKGYGVTIGVTGSYIIDLSIGAEIQSVTFGGSPDNQDANNKIVQHQGSLTYAYYSRVQNRFDSISNIIINDIAAHQFISEHDIINEIEDIRSKIHSIYWIRAILREVFQGYKGKDGVYYADSYCTVPIVWDDYVLYHITDLNNISEKEYWYDHRTDTKYNYYDPNIYFNRNVYGELDKNKGMSLEETKEYSIKNPKDITTLACGNGVIVEISYQIQTLEYRVETSDTYPILKQARIDMDKAYEELQFVLRPYDEDGNWNALWDENDIEYHELQIQQATLLYNQKYNEFIIELERVLEEEEAAQGDIVA